MSDERKAIDETIFNEDVEAGDASINVSAERTTWQTSVGTKAQVHSIELHTSRSPITVTLKMEVDEAATLARTILAAVATTKDSQS